MKITLTNDFHNTDVTLYAKPNTFLSDHQVQRAHKALCGSDNCDCGVVRGYQQYGLTEESGGRWSISQNWED